MHFGTQYEPLPNDEQIYLADLLTNNGADVIIGHHPHVLQPVDWVSSENSHDRFVMYSLGNFYPIKMDLIEISVRSHKLNSQRKEHTMKQVIRFQMLK